MNLNKHYTHPSTSQRMLLESISDPRIYLADDIDKFNPTLWQAFLRYIGSISGRSPSAVVPRIHLEGALYNLLHGGPHVPHCRLLGKETRLATDAAASATSLTITHAQRPAFWSGAGVDVVTANTSMLLMHRRPEPGESILTAGVTNCEAEILAVGAYSAGTTTVPVTAITTARKAGAVIQEILGVPASYYGTDMGFLYELERPDAPTVGTMVDAGSQTIDVVWTHSSQAADTITTLSSGESGPGVVNNYSIFILKKGDTYCVEGPPKNVPERIQPSVTQAITVGGLSGTTWTKSGVATYWKPSDNSLAAIVAGDYYVGVACMNQAAFDPNLRMSRIAWTTTALTVA